MKAWIAVALVAGATLAHAQGTPAPAQGTPAPAASAAASAPSSPAKKALVVRVLQLQQPGMEGLARQIAERPVRQLLQDASQVLQTQVPADKREAIARTVEADARQFFDEAVPVIREQAVKLAPATIGTMLEERFTEDELKQIVGWLESPVQRKYMQLSPELDRALVQKLSNEIAPLLDPKLQALQQKTRAAFGMPPAGGASGAAGARSGANAGRPAASGAAASRSPASAPRPASR